MSSRTVIWGLDHPEAERGIVRDMGLDVLAAFVGDTKHVLGDDSPTRADAISSLRSLLYARTQSAYHGIYFIFLSLHLLLN